jgi:hypothetical protein
MTNPPLTATPPQTHRILGIDFFDGSAKAAIEIMRSDGLLVIPPPPALKDLECGNQSSIVPKSHRRTTKAMKYRIRTKDQPHTVTQRSQLRVVIL